MSISRALWETADLVAKWEADRPLRARVRTKGSLVLRSGAVDSTQPSTGPVERSTANCRLNKHVLLPVLNHMSIVELKLPPIEVLLLRCQEFFDEASTATASPCIVYQNAWGIRRLTQLVKSKLYKEKPPKDQGTNKSILVGRFAHPQKPVYVK